MKILITFIIALFFYNNSIIAHQPKLIKYSPDENNPYIISDPEISKAFYGKLNGQSHWYKIDSNKSFLFYAGILTPENKEFNYVSIKVLNQNKEILYEANGKDFEWKLWYEPYARDNYWKGPEIGNPTNKEFMTSFEIPADKYYIVVYNEKNIGHYSLAVGEAEFFGSDIWQKTLTWIPIIFYIGPYMDIVHWKKFDITTYIPHISLIVLFFIIYLITRKIISKKN